MGESVRPWVCDSCELIGSEAEAQRHHDKTSHKVRALNDAELAFWDQHMAGLRYQRAAAFLTFAKRHTMAFREARDAA